jgi:subtilisin family serine protease
MSVQPDKTADAAVDGAVARATYGVDGSGVTVGVISDSFDADGDYPVEVAAGDLPPGVTILADVPVGTDEGRAMAELIYETAPGASLVFADATDGTGIADEANFAAAVSALQAAGAQIIVDDVATEDEPTFQLGDALDDAIAGFIAVGGDYFTAAGNDGPDYYQGRFDGALTSLSGIGMVTAASFAPEVGRDALTLAPGTPDIEVRLDWSQPDGAVGGSSGSDDTLNLYLLDSSGRIVAESTADRRGGDPYQVLDYAVPIGSDDHFSVVAALANGLAPAMIRLTAIGDPGTFAYAGGGTGELSGHALVPGVNVVGAAYDDGVWPVAEPYSETGGGTLLYSIDGNPLTPSQPTAGISFDAADGSTTSLGGDFAPFYGTSAAAPVAAAVAALMLQASPALTPAEITADLAASALPMAAAAQSGAGLIQAPGAMEAAEKTACFAEGTRIRTPRGDVPVEELRVGDLVALLGGGLGPIRWIGWRRIDCRRHVSPSAVWPIRIEAGAFAGGSPLADLLLSPDHAVHVEDVLIPIRHLANGGTVRQAQRDEVAYFHLEFARHEVIMAEGLPVESYLDTGDRQGFDAGVVDANPVFGGTRLDTPLLWDALAAAPLCVCGPRVERVRAMLAKQAEAMRRAAV